MTAYDGLAPIPYRIRPMEPGEGRVLQSIDRSTRPLFVANGHGEFADLPDWPLADFARFLVTHDVLVAEHEETEELVGFAAATDRESLYWLAELSVMPAHGRRGIGTALLSAIERSASWHGFKAVGLTTFADVPFNRPFYERRGFATLPTAELDPVLAERLRAETPPVSRREDRRVMIKRL